MNLRTATRAFIIAVTVLVIVVALIAGVTRAGHHGSPRPTPPASAQVTATG